jgi:hypothetical protein
MTLVEPAPIACSLNPAEFSIRRARIADLNRTALASYRRDDLRLELSYAIEARPQVLEMVQAEQTCCAFLTFEVREEHGAVRVIVEAPERARDAANSILEAFYSTAPSQGACGCRSASIPADRVVGTSAALAAAGALVCGVCCVLPFALPAAVLAMSGGVVGWFAKATPWATGIASVAVVSGWIWVAIQTARTKRQPARSTLLTLGVATAVFATAAVWWHFEREIIHLLR